MKSDQEYSSERGLDAAIPAEELLLSPQQVLESQQWLEQWKQQERQEQQRLSTSTGTLETLFSQDKELAAGWIDTIGKDIFPNGLIKFSLHSFFNELLNDSDRAALLKIPKKDITALCRRAIEIADKGQYDRAMLDKKMRNISEFYDYTFCNKSSSQDMDIDDPSVTLTYVKKLLETSNYGTKKTEAGSRIKKAGVVEFRLPASKDGTIRDVRELVTSSLDRYKNFCGKISAERAEQKGTEKSH